jgi:hypothetical protein
MSAKEPTERCKNCKFWTREKLVYSDCVINMCAFEAPWQENGISSAEPRAEALDDTGLEVWLETGPEYGCIHFAPAEGKSHKTEVSCE